MRKIGLFLSSVLAIALLINFTSVQARPAQGPEIERVGYVVAYMPAQSITIVDEDGYQFTFALASNLEFFPLDLANQLAPGAYVTVVALNDATNGKQIATRIMIDAKPTGAAASPLPTKVLQEIGTPLPTKVLQEIGTPLPTKLIQETWTPLPTKLITDTPPVAPTVTGTPETPPAGGASTTTSQSSSPITSFFSWLASLFGQLFSTSN